MNKLILRLYLVERDEYLNVRFDGRLSFDENFELMGAFYEYDFRECLVIDPVLKKALSKDVPLYRFNLPAFRTLFVY